MRNRISIDIVEVMWHQLLESNSNTRKYLLDVYSIGIIFRSRSAHILPEYFTYTNCVFHLPTHLIRICLMWSDPRLLEVISPQSEQKHPESNASSSQRAQQPLPYLLHNHLSMAEQVQFQTHFKFQMTRLCLILRYLLQNHLPLPEQVKFQTQIKFQMTRLCLILRYLLQNHLPLPEQVQFQTQFKFQMTRLRLILKSPLQLR